MFCHYEQLIWLEHFLWTERTFKYIYEEKKEFVPA